MNQEFERLRNYVAVFLLRLKVKVCRFVFQFRFSFFSAPPVDSRPEQSRSVKLIKLFFNLLAFSSFFYAIFLSFGYDGKNFKISKWMVI